MGADRSEIEGLVAQLREPSYRARQIAEWLYRKNVSDFSSMSNLPSGLRERLASIASLSKTNIISRTSSSDGTTKFLLELGDGEKIESVLLPYEDRLSVCVSTQVGCAADCTFCATASLGFIRNLTAGEIVDQVLLLEHEAGRRVTNVVYMGMGEPLHNYDQVMKSVRLLNSEVGIAMRKITISTVGVTPIIKRLQAENLQLTLAVSLHASEDRLRQRLMPISKRYPLQELISTCREYAENTRRRVTYEYLLISGVNDGIRQAERLVSLLRRSLAIVNLIPYNEVPEKPYRRSSATAVQAFRKVLEEGGIEVTQRLERGRVVAAACGQLRAGRTVSSFDKEGAK